MKKYIILFGVMILLMVNVNADTKVYSFNTDFKPQINYNTATSASCSNDLMRMDSTITLDSDTGITGNIKIWNLNSSIPLNLFNSSYNGLYIYIRAAKTGSNYAYTTDYFSPSTATSTFILNSTIVSQSINYTEISVFKSLAIGENNTIIALNEGNVSMLTLYSNPATRGIFCEEVNSSYVRTIAGEFSGYTAKKLSNQENIITSMTIYSAPTTTSLATTTTLKSYMTNVNVSVNANGNDMDLTTNEINIFHCSNIDYYDYDNLNWENGISFYELRRDNCVLLDSGYTTALGKYNTQIDLQNYSNFMVDSLYNYGYIDEINYITSSEIRPRLFNTSYYIPLTYTNYGNYEYCFSIVDNNLNPVYNVSYNLASINGNIFGVNADFVTCFNYTYASNDFTVTLSKYKYTFTPKVFNLVGDGSITQFTMYYNDNSSKVSLSGYVLNVSLSPLKNVNNVIYCDYFSKSAYTNTNGYFIINDLPNNTNCRMTSYSPLDGQNVYYQNKQTLLRLSGNTVINITLDRKLTSNNIVSKRIGYYDTDGIFIPLSNVKVGVSGCNLETPVVFTSDSNGYIYFSGLEECSYQFLINYNGYEEYSNYGDVTDIGDNDNIILYPEIFNDCKVTGYIYSSDNNKTVNTGIRALVTIYLGNSEISSIMADNTGYYSFNVLCDTDYNIKAEFFDLEEKQSFRVVNGESKILQKNIYFKTKTLERQSIVENMIEFLYSLVVLIQVVFFMFVCMVIIMLSKKMGG